jgi:hypothetical protein
MVIPTKKPAPKPHKRNKLVQWYEEGDNSLSFWLVVFWSLLLIACNYWSPVTIIVKAGQ